LRIPADSANASLPDASIPGTANAPGASRQDSLVDDVSIGENCRLTPSDILLENGLELRRM